MPRRGRGREAEVDNRGREAVVKMGTSPPDNQDDAVALPIEDHLDLHTFSPREIPSVVEEYLAQAARRGYQEVRLIHGKGKGAQRAIVQALLASHPLVAHYADAPPERGGWGGDGGVFESARIERLDCLSGQSLHVPGNLFDGHTRAVSRSEQIEARGRRAPEAYSVIH